MSEMASVRVESEDIKRHDNEVLVGEPLPLLSHCGLALKCGGRVQHVILYLTMRRWFSLGAAKVDIAKWKVPKGHERAAEGGKSSKHPALLSRFS